MTAVRWKMAKCNESWDDPWPSRHCQLRAAPSFPSGLLSLRTTISLFPPPPHNEAVTPVTLQLYNHVQLSLSLLLVISPHTSSEPIYPICPPSLPPAQPRAHPGVRWAWCGVMNSDRSNAWRHSYSTVVCGWPIPTASSQTKGSPSSLSLSVQM